MKLGIENKVAVVGAASRGIGKAVAIGLAAEGVKLAICGRTEGPLREAAVEMEALGAEVLPITADLTIAAEIDRFTETVLKHFGTVDILVNNCGGPPTGTFETIDDGGWASAIEQVLMMPIRLTRAFLPAMRAQRWGRIVNISSATVKQPLPNMMLSNSLRMAVLGWAKALSREVASDRILVNTVCPGWTRTERVEDILKQDSAVTGKTMEALEAQRSAGIPLGRIGEAREIAALAVFLASEPAGYITGTAIAVDGGAVHTPS